MPDDVTDQRELLDLLETSLADIAGALVELSNSGTTSSIEQALVDLPGDMAERLAEVVKPLVAALEARKPQPVVVNVPPQPAPVLVLPPPAARFRVTLHDKYGDPERVLLIEREAS